eukprot:GHVR01185463.1.p1 GENE.GHVR01185463.1~~GHVR01185463.1.p1  ORF type:complete len:140 (+),score=19.08 GHVR01185463.1:2775-3194(+)
MKVEDVSQSVIQLNTHKSYEYASARENVANLLQKVENEFVHNNAELVVAPYAEEEHFIGLVFRVGNEGRLSVDYMDSENRDIKKDFEEEILKERLNINQIIVTEQNYNDNCGVETIENIIGYLKGEDLTYRRITQECAI